MIKSIKYFYLAIIFGIFFSIGFLSVFNYREQVTQTGLGAVTFIESTSTIKDSRTTINDNFTYLDGQITSLNNASTSYLLVSASTSLAYVSNSYGSSTYSTYTYGSSTYVIKDSASNVGNFMQFDSGGNAHDYGWAPSSFVTFAYASSSYLLVSASTSLNYVGFTYASSTFVNFTYATSTFLTKGNASTSYIGFAYGSSTFPTFTYGSSTYARSLLTPSLTIASTSLIGGASTTTIPLAYAGYAETWSSAICGSVGGTGVGTTTLQFGDGTNWTNILTATSTAYDKILSSNNTFTLAEPRFIRVQTTAGSPDYITCTIHKTQD